LDIISRGIIQVWMPASIVLFIVLELLIIPSIGDKERKIRRNVVKVFVLLTTIFMILIFNEVQRAPVVYEIGNVFGMGAIFRIDMLNYVFIILTGIVWLALGIYSLEDINYVFYTLTYFAIIGTLMAGDLLSFFLFFEAMTFISYALMVYHRGEDQLEAGKVYIYMGIIGGLSILSGILMLSAYTGSFEWSPLAVQFSEMGPIKYIIAAFLIGGFGIKAGMVPFHFWMPKVYEGGPISVVALSSGILIKIGAYGILRVVSVVFSVTDSARLSSVELLWQVSRNIGAVVIWIGIITMVVGVFMALQQGNMKRMLAYHSVSQMGYMIMGIGVAGYLGYEGAMGFAGAVFHMINHAFFKVILFMVAGLVFLRTREWNMYKLGGLWKKMPLTALLCLIAVFGITGMPGFNGFASKSVLHHAIDEAYLYGHEVFRYAELLFVIVSAGTVCSFLKFFGYIFLGDLAPEYEKIEGDHYRMNGAMGILAFFVIAIGLNPSFFFEGYLIPAASSFTYSPEFIQSYLVGLEFFGADEIVDFLGVYIIGFGMFVVGVKFHLFSLPLPKWINAERFIYKPVTVVCEKFPNFCVQQFEKRIIFGDVVIYAVLLTVILGMLIVFGI